MRTYVHIVDLEINALLFSARNCASVFWFLINAHLVCVRARASRGMRTFLVTIWSK